jgi:hypothetical protein
LLTVGEMWESNRSRLCPPFPDFVAGLYRAISIASCRFNVRRAAV